jgi:hypothetical protein
MLRFDVFGMRVGIEREPEGWKAYYLGNAGKKRPADFVVPAHLAEGDLLRYLTALFREAASPHHPRVVRLE